MDSPIMKGRRIPIMAYLEPAVYRELENIRGICKRSSYVENLIVTEIKKSGKFSS